MKNFFQMYCPILVFCMCLMAIKGITVKDDDIKYYLYTRTVNGTQFDRTNISDISFNASKETIFFLHGWRDTYVNRPSQIVKTAYLSSRDFNVILVDWSNIAKENNYTIVRYSVTQVGSVLGRSIHFMTDEVSLSLKKTGIVAYSLGVQVAGNAGRTLRGRLDRLIAIDPAGPEFKASGDNLNKHDAKFVQVIHTSDNYGTIYTLGDADYWVNGGKDPQPGCNKTIDMCSHARAIQYYNESLTGGTFIARQCSTYELYRTGLCNKNPSAIMGNDAIDRRYGTFQLSTNSRYPFAKN